MDPVQMWCTAAKVEYENLPHWSQAKDKIARAMWHNGCTAELQALGEMPVTSGTTANWAVPERQPPVSTVTPGDPNDQQPGRG